jgi:hypothetical protein
LFILKEQARVLSPCFFQDICQIIIQTKTHFSKLKQRYDIILWNKRLLVLGFMF